MTSFRVLGWLLLVTGSTAWAQPGREGRLLRFPALHADKIVFTYAGDLYQVPRSGGLARRITDHPGDEMFARFSPDGKQLAFSAQYDGNTEVYMMPAEGGTPKRLTYTATLGRDDLADRMGPNNIVMTWTPEGNGVVYRSRQHSFNAFKGQLFAAPINGDISIKLPFSVAGWGTYSPDGRQFAYNRTFREFRTWKYYQGGMAPDVWVYDADAGTSTNITDNPAQDVYPMWYQDRIYFCSDRDRTMNLYVHDTQTGSTRRVTNFKDFDVKFPSLGDDAIVFENGGYVYILNLQTEQVQQVPIRLADDAMRSSGRYVDARESIQGAALSPDGNRVILHARGDLFSLPRTTGVTRHLLNTPEAHERNPVWSPDGQQVAYWSDASGEFELYVHHAVTDEVRQLTNRKGGYPYALKWSPNGEHLLFADKALTLNVVDAGNGKIQQIARNTTWEYSVYEWSPDGQWVVYGEPQRGTHSRVLLYSLQSGLSTVVSDGFFNDHDVTFTPDGRFLVMSSERHFDPAYSNTEWNHAYLNTQKLYLLPLAASTPSPFAPENLESENPRSEKPEGQVGEAESNPADELPKVNVDLANIQQRWVGIPAPNASYANLQAAGPMIYALMRKQGSDATAGKAQLVGYHLGKKAFMEFGAVAGFQLSGNGQRMFVSTDAKSHYVINVPQQAEQFQLPDSLKLDLSGLEYMTDRQAEFQQMFAESWRQMRDFFYAPNLHGVDWKAVRKKYEPLVAHCAHRNDLSYVIGEMIGELNVGHAYVGGGDRPQAERVNMGLLGAELSRHRSGYYRIDSLIPGESWNPETHNPLMMPGVAIQEGDFLIEVNGQDVSRVDNLNELLVGTAGRQIELRVSEKPDNRNTRTSVIVPLADESALRYRAWVDGNRAFVEKRTNGRVGYLHIPNMIQAGLNEFARNFYPQVGKDALIIDVRGNGGGNVSPMIIERLSRQLQIAAVARNTAPYSSPREVHLGPKIALIDRYTASDGDLFAYRFRQMELGPIIGERSWGGVVGIRGSLPLLDGGYLRKPEFAHFAPDGSDWVIEGYGVDPDIEVVNDPVEEYAGEDAQLNRAIQEALVRLQTASPRVPDAPAYPER